MGSWVSRQTDDRQGIPPAACAAASAVGALVGALLARRYAVVAVQPCLGRLGDDETDAATAKSSVKPRGKTKADAAGKRDKGAERLEWWQRLNQVKPALIVPEPRITMSAIPAFAPPVSAEAVHKEVARVVKDRLGRGRDWLVRDSDYGIAPAHAGVKAKVNAALVQAMLDVFGPSLPEQLTAEPQRILLLLDTPQYGTLSNIVATFPRLRCCQQVVIPQADLGHYFEMTRAGSFYPGVRAQRLDHWLCANHELGLSSLVAFLDFECRLVGSLSARLCPAADIMRYFRFGYPADPASLLALTVGLEEPASTPEAVDAFVRWEAMLNGYTAELLEVWKYRMATLLYVVRPASQSATSDVSLASAAKA